MKWSTKSTVRKEKRTVIDDLLLFSLCLINEKNARQRSEENACVVLFIKKNTTKQPTPTAHSSLTKETKRKKMKRKKGKWSARFLLFTLLLFILLRSCLTLFTHHVLSFISLWFNSRFHSTLFHFIVIEPSERKERGVWVMSERNERNCCGWCLTRVPVLCCVLCSFAIKMKTSGAKWARVSF